MKKNLDLWKIWAASLALSLLLAWVFYASGKAGDCKPGQIDGQCGLSTAIGFVFAIGLVFVVQTVTVICLMVVAAKRRKKLQADN